MAGHKLDGLILLSSTKNPRGILKFRSTVIIGSNKERWKTLIKSMSYSPIITITGHKRLIITLLEGNMNTEAALTAKAIRKELKKFFSNVKFRVISQTFAHGNSVEVIWNGAVTNQEVWKIVGKYQCGEFNAMTDSYEYTNVRKDIPQVTFVIAKRGAYDGVAILSSAASN